MSVSGLDIGNSFPALSIILHRREEPVFNFSVSNTCTDLGEASLAGGLD